jgi:hypothetical protein
MLDRINKDFIFSPVNYVSRVQNLFDLKDKLRVSFAAAEFMQHFGRCHPHPPAAEN